MGVGDTGSLHHTCRVVNYLGEAGEFCYFHMPENEAALELLYLSELPPPELTIG